MIPYFSPGAAFGVISLSPRAGRPGVQGVRGAGRPPRCVGELHPHPLRWCIRAGARFLVLSAALNGAKTAMVIKFLAFPPALQCFASGPRQAKKVSF